MQYTLRSGTPPALREIHRFIAQLNLDCDINHRAAYVGEIRGDMATLRSELIAGIRRTGVAGALAYLLDVPEAAVTITVQADQDPLPNDLTLITRLATSYHNAHPLAVNEALRAWIQPIAGGACLVFVKLNHLSADARDAAELFAQMRDYLSHGSAIPAETFSQTPEHHRRFEALPRADVEVAERLLGEPAPPRISGSPLIAKARDRLVAVRDGLVFDDVLEAVARSLIPWAGNQVVLHYPYTHKQFRSASGPFVEIKPLVVEAADLAADGTAALRRRRRGLESSGRLDASELHTFNTALKRRRVPRFIVSDTTLFRPENDEWRWIPTKPARTFDDLKFYVDRTQDQCLMRIQYKEGFVEPGVVEDIVARIQERIA